MTNLSFATWFYQTTPLTEIFLFDQFHFTLTDFTGKGHQGYLFALGIK